jgi:hypothetical protein
MNKGDIIEHRYQPNRIGVIVKLKSTDKQHKIWDVLVEWANGQSSWVSLNHIKPYSNG